LAEFDGKPFGGAATESFESRDHRSGPFKKQANPMWQGSTSVAFKSKFWRGTVSSRPSTEPAPACLILHAQLFLQPSGGHALRPRKFRRNSELTTATPLVVLKQDRQLIDTACFFAALSTAKKLSAGWGGFMPRAGPPGYNPHAMPNLCLRL